MLGKSRICHIIVIPTAAWQQQTFYPFHLIFKKKKIVFFGTREVKLWKKNAQQIKIQNRTRKDNRGTKQESQNSFTVPQHPPGMAWWLTNINIPLFHRSTSIVNTNPLCCRHPHTDLLLRLLIFLFFYSQPASLMTNLIDKLHKKKSIN